MLNLHTLNPKQAEAVTAPLSAVLVSAGAGSGKTKVLAFRVAYLIEQGLVESSRILALTFTNKAAREMQARVQQLLGVQIPNDHQSASGQASDHFQSSDIQSQEASNFQLPTLNFQLPRMGTFHSIGVRILREWAKELGLPKGFAIFDEQDTERLVKKILKELEAPEKFSASWARSLISSAKNKLSEPEHWEPEVPRQFTQVARSAYQKYQKLLKENGGVDFDDLIALPVKLWQAQSQVLEIFRQRFAYVLVDEFQDTNPVQYLWLKLLCWRGNIFAVGDDAQSIYGFRGSDLGNWQRFQKDFAPCKVVHLEQNYRSTQNILDASGAVLASHKDHLPKKLWTESGGGAKVSVRQLRDERDEASFVVKEIAKLARPQSSSSRVGEVYEYQEEEVEESGFSGGLLDRYLSSAKTFGVKTWELKGLGMGLDKSVLGQIAILYRTHGQSRSFEEALIVAGIDYRVVGGVRFYQRKEVKDVLSALRLLLYPKDTVALERLVSVLPLGLGDKSLAHIFSALGVGQDTPSLFEEDAGGNREDNWWDLGVRNLASGQLSSARRDSALKFFGKMSALSKLAETLEVSVVLEKILSGLEFESLIRDGTENGEGRWDSVRELLTVAKERCAELPWRLGAEKLLEEAALLASQDEDAVGGAVQLMSIHAAKGLEFDTVFVVGLEEGLLPHSRALIKPEELAEEIRLMYVAMTRARKKLYLTYAQSRILGGSVKTSPSSRFLRHLPKASVDMQGAGGGFSHSFPKNSPGLTYEPMDF